MNMIFGYYIMNYLYAYFLTGNKTKEKRKIYIENN